MPEMMWKQDAEIDATRKRPGWAAFHRRCGQSALYFDHPERQGRRGGYQITAFSATRRAGFYETRPLATSSGATVLDALAAAYRDAGRPVADAELATLLAGPVYTDLDQLLGGESASELEDLLG